MKEKFKTKVIGMKTIILFFWFISFCSCKSQDLADISYLLDFKNEVLLSEEFDFKKFNTYVNAHKSINYN